MCIVSPFTNKFLLAPNIYAPTQQKRLRTHQEILADFRRKGISVAAWARAHGYSEQLTLLVLNGKRKAIRGQSHNIAVELGLKDGEIVREHEIATALTA